MPRPEFTLHDLLANSVERDAQGVAVVEGEDEHTYEDLERESNALGAALVESGVGKGDRVGVYLEKSWEAIVAMLAASRVGAAYVNINPLFKPPQVAYLAQDCDIRVMIGDSVRLADLEPGTVSGTAFYKGEAPTEGVAGGLVDLAEALASGEEPAQEQARLGGGPGDDPLHLRLHGDAEGRGDQPAQRRGGRPDRLDVPGEHRR